MEITIGTCTICNESFRPLKNGVCALCNLGISKELRDDDKNV